MTKTTKYVLAGGALAGILYLAFRGNAKTDPSGSITTTVIKTSDECDPASANYKGPGPCSASSDPISQATGALSSVGSALVDAFNGLFGTGKPNPTDTDTDNGFTPSLPPKTDDAGANHMRVSGGGTDGPITRPLQVVYGIGTKLSSVHEADAAGGSTTKVTHGR